MTKVAGKKKNRVELKPARKINENTENAETVGANQNPDSTIIIINITIRPIRSRKPPQPETYL